MGISLPGSKSGAKKDPLTSSERVNQGTDTLLGDTHYVSIFTIVVLWKFALSALKCRPADAEFRDQLNESICLWSCLPVPHPFAFRHGLRETGRLFSGSRYDNFSKQFMHGTVQHFQQAIDDGHA